MTIERDQSCYAWMDDLLADAVMSGIVEDVPFVDHAVHLSDFSPLPVMTARHAPKMTSNSTGTWPDTALASVSVDGSSTTTDQELDWKHNDFDFDAHFLSQENNVTLPLNDRPGAISPLVSEQAPIPLPSVELATDRVPVRKNAAHCQFPALTRLISTDTQQCALASRASSDVLPAKSRDEKYIDYADVPEDQQGIPFRERNLGGVQNPFPDRLHNMLTENKFPDVVAWSPHGRCFVVLKPKEFEAKVLPLYFNQTKYRSFQRQLNLYGLKRLTRDADRGGYYHPLFLRGRGKLATRMRRQKIKGGSAVSSSSDASLFVDFEPDFYAMKTVI